MSDEAYMYMVQPYSTAVHHADLDEPEVVFFATVVEAKASVQAGYPDTEIVWRDFPAEEVCVAAAEMSDDAYQIHRVRIKA
jgi:hypothetical protein